MYRRDQLVEDTCCGYKCHSCIDYICTSVIRGLRPGVVAASVDTRQRAEGGAGCDTRTIIKVASVAGLQLCYVCA